MTSDRYNLIKMSKKKYETREINTQKLMEPLLNIGNDRYIIVNAKTNALNVGLPYLLYCIDVQIVLSLTIGAAPAIM